MTTYSYTCSPTYMADINSKYYVQARKEKQSNGTNYTAFTKNKLKAAY